MWHIHCWNISHVTCTWSLTFKVFKLMKEQQILLGTSFFPMAWILWNSPACMPKWSKGYEIRKNRSRDLQNTLITLNKNALIHLARLIDNPDSFADNLMTSILRWSLTTLPRLRKQILWRHSQRSVMWCLGWIFEKYFSEICLIISLWNPLLCVIKRGPLHSLWGGLFSLSTHAVTSLGV